MDKKTEGSLRQILSDFKLGECRMSEAVEWIDELMTIERSKARKRVQQKKITK